MGRICRVGAGLVLAALLLAGCGTGRGGSSTAPLLNRPDHFIYFHLLDQTQTGQTDDELFLQLRQQFAKGTVSLFTEVLPSNNATGVAAEKTVEGFTQAWENLRYQRGAQPITALMSERARQIASQHDLDKLIGDSRAAMAFKGHDLDSYPLLTFNTQFTRAQAIRADRFTFVKADEPFLQLFPVYTANGQPTGAPSQGVDYRISWIINLVKEQGAWRVDEYSWRLEEIR